MCCFFTLMVVLGPRVAGVIWWLLRPALWQSAFNTIVWPILGLIFVPWTTLMYMLVFPGGVTGFDWVWLGLAFIADIASYAGGGYGNRNRIPGYASN